MSTSTVARSRNDHASAGQHGRGTTHPIFGVLTQPVDTEERFMSFTKEYSEYIPASFVRWLESGGARVIAIQLRPQCTATTLMRFF